MAALHVGIAGLGAGSRLVLPAFAGLSGVALTGAADVRAAARAVFTRDHDLPAFDSVEALCRADIDAIWIETPNHLHCEHAAIAARHGKHIICAKPMAATADECDAMIAAAKKAGIKLLIGHSKIFDPAIRAMAEVARSGRLGAVAHIDICLYTDWLRRPRLAEELDADKGAGFILRQAPHLVDIANVIVGRRACAVRAMAGRWDANVSTEGNCAALIAYEGGGIASLSLNGYGFFDTGELTFGIGTLGDLRPDPRKTKPRPRQTGTQDADEKFAAPTQARERHAAQPFFGLTLVSCEHGLMRQSPDGILLYTDDGCEELPVPPYRGRAAELIELRDALRENRAVFPDGTWGRDNLILCRAILDSAREGREITL